MIKVYQRQRKGWKEAVWCFDVVLDQELKFSSAFVSIRFEDERWARWLARVVESLALQGRNLSRRPVLQWEGDTDSHTRSGDFFCHVEHLDGPLRRGGLWYWGVRHKEQDLSFLPDWHGIRVRSARAGQWLCELLLAALEANVEAVHELERS